MSGGSVNLETERRRAVDDILANVEPGPRQIFLDLALAVRDWPEVGEAAYYHLGEWSPVYTVRGQQILHVHFHKPHVISVTLPISGQLGACVLAEPHVGSTMKRRIERDWRAGEAYVEFRVKSDVDRRSVEAAARAVHRCLITESAGARA